MVYKIRGSIAFKIVNYVLVALLAFATAFLGGMVCQGLYMGVATDTENGAGMYSTLISNYSNEISNELIISSEDYINSKVSEVNNIRNYSELQRMDANEDGIIDVLDVNIRLLGNAMKSSLKSSPKYKETVNRGDYGYVIHTMTEKGGKSVEAMAPVWVGNDTIADKNDHYIDICEHALSVGVEPVKYLVFNTMADAQLKYKEIFTVLEQHGDSYYNDALEGYYEDEYDEEEYYEEEYEVDVTEQATVENIENTTEVAVLEAEYPEYMYEDRYPYRVECEYWNGASNGGPYVENGYVLKLYYENQGYINVTGTLYVDSEKAIENINCENNRMAANLRKWKDNFGTILALFIVCSILLLAAIVTSMAGSGVKAGKETVELSSLERAPTELVAALLITAIAGVCVCGLCLKSVCVSTMVESAGFPYESILYVALLVPAALAATVALVLFNNLIAKLRAKRLLGDCILIRIIKKICSSAAGGVRSVKNRLTLKWQGIVIYTIITIVEIIGVFMVCLAFSYGEAALLFIIVCIALKIFCMAWIGIILMETQELYKCGEDMANGNLDRKVNSARLHWVFKAHGEHLNEIGDGMAKAVEEKVKSERLKTELITNVSHDIKTPLTSIINYVDLLGKDDVDEETRKQYLDVLSRQSMRLKKLIEDLVEASKASTGNIPMNMAELDVNLLLEQAVAEYEDKLERAGLTVIFRPEKQPAVVLADGQHLWRVFDNLLGNICKYAMSGTRVYAQVSQDGDRICIEFKNISRQSLNISSDELIERFVRGDSSRNTEGSGLGLSIANSLCALMNAGFNISIDGDLFKTTIIFTHNGNSKQDNTD